MDHVGRPMCSHIVHGRRRTSYDPTVCMDHVRRPITPLVATLCMDHERRPITPLVATLCMDHIGRHITPLVATLYMDHIGRPYIALYTKEHPTGHRSRSANIVNDVSRNLYS